MKAAIVEDEAVFADRLRQRVDELFRSKDRQAEISCFPDGGSFLAALQGGKSFGLVFFDIQLGNDDGMDIAARLRKYDKNAAVIFVTGLSDRAAEGYEVEAFDYIVKSRLDERLENVLDRFFGRLEKSSLSVSLADGGRALIPFLSFMLLSPRAGGRLYTRCRDSFIPGQQWGKFLRSCLRGITLRYTRAFMSALNAYGALVRIR